jgi:tetratricopeptide (TPR) repeat protein
LDEFICGFKTHFQVSSINSEMFKINFLIFFFIIQISTVSVATEMACPERNLLQNKDLSDSVLTVISGLKEECLVKEIKLAQTGNSPEINKKIVTVIEKWTDVHGFSASLLNNLYWNTNIRSNRVCLPSIFELFRKKNGSVYETATSLISKGQSRLADSIFILFNESGMVGPYETLRWIKVKMILGEYGAVASLACRTLSAEATLIPAALNQLSIVLEEMPPDTADRVIKSFVKCWVQRPGSDTVALRSWASDKYDELGMYDREVQVLISLETKFSSVTEELIEIARRCFENRQFTNVILPAREAYKRLPEGEHKNYVASLVYNSFNEIGLRDSAFIWMSRVKQWSIPERTRAASLFQESGQFQKSQNCIDSLSPSLSKDTLSIRQLLFTGDKKKADELAFRSVSLLSKSRQDAAVWRARTLLFSSSAERLRTLLDSVLIDPSWRCAGELLSYRYWIRRLENSDESLAAWMQIEYNCFIGKPEKGSEIILNGKLDKDSRWRLAIRVSEALLGKNRITESRKLLDGCSEGETSAEFLFCKSETLLRSGDYEGARRILQHIIMDFPDDIFSSKARLVLNRTPALK